MMEGWLLVMSCDEIIKGPIELSKTEGRHEKDYTLHQRISCVMPDLFLMITRNTQ